MTWSEVIAGYDLLDDPEVDGKAVAAWLHERGVEDVESTTVAGEHGSTDFVRAVVPGARGRTAGGPAGTLGIIGRLGGVGARPEQTGYVSDGDGALTAVAAAARLGRMRARGDVLAGDVIVATHICPHAPTLPHDPVPFMNSPVDIATMNAHELDPGMDAVLSVDATKGNRVCNHKGFAISPTVKQGWILRAADPLLDIATRVTGQAPVVLPLAVQDITPYGNGVHHINSILQPATGTDAPVVGVAITTEATVAGSATGASDLASVEAATRFCVEVAKDFSAGNCSFFDETEFARLVDLYGSLERLSRN